MRKLLLIFIILWFTIIALLISSFITSGTNKNNSYKVEVNRLHQQILEAYNHLGMSGFSEQSAQLAGNYTSIDEVILIDTDDDLSLVLLEETPMENKDYLFKALSDSSMVIRYTVTTESNQISAYPDHFYRAIGLTSLVFLMFVIATYFYVVMPLKRLSAYPNDMAKGRLYEKATVTKNGLFKEFLWGLDLLREVLIDEKNKNLELEKQRKTLVASMSHDIRTPLSSIKNYTMALQDNLYESQDDKEKALKVIMEKAEVIDGLTSDLLDSTRNAMENIHCNVSGVYLKNLLGKCVHLIENKTSLMQIELKQVDKVFDCLILADVDRFLEVMDNVIENAIKYGDKGWIRLATLSEEGNVIVQIENSGPGIKKEELKYIFNSFYRGSNTEGQNGHGLGLYIVKQIMRAMNGDVVAINTSEGFMVQLILRMDR